MAQDKPGQDRLGYSVKRAEQALMARKAHALREFDLTVAQYGALQLLSTSAGMSAAQLARDCLVTPQTMATVLGNLEAKGLIERHASELHQKVLVTTVTPAGRALAREANRAALAVERELAAEFSAEELAMLRALLERAAKTLAR
ncbi:MAG: MarR family winged helix-turn-helix transcriptional regulator [Thermocrispum sp.]